MVRGLNHGEEIAKPLRDYEILYIVRPDVEEADLPDTTKKVESLIESLGGHFFATRWADVIIFSILILVLVFVPSGLFGRAAATRA